MIDASQIILDYTVPKEQRINMLINEIKNPYCFRVGEIGVKLEFLDNRQSLQNVFCTFLKQQKSGI